MAELRKAIRNGGSEQIRGYGDMSLTELLPALLTSYNETEMLIAAPSIPDQAAEIIRTWMRWQWVKIDGSGKIYVLTHLTLIADLGEKKSPMVSEWLTKNPWGDRLTLVDKGQKDTVLLLPDIAITGPVNLRYGRQFTATATTDAETIAGLWAKFVKRMQDSDEPAGVARAEDAPGSAEDAPEPTPVVEPAETAEPNVI